MTTPVLIYDDQDNSVSYTGYWRQAKGAVAEYGGTATFTNVTGATANLTFVGEVLHFLSTYDH